MENSMKQVNNFQLIICIFIAGLICGMIAYALIDFGAVQLSYRIVYSEITPPSVQVLVDRDYYYSLIADLQSANCCIKVAMYSMIYDEDDPFDWANDLIRELVYAKQRDVNVSVVIEYRTYYGYMDDNLPAYNYLLSNGVNVKLDYETDTDHLKLVLIDDKITYVGSHNWSESALYYNHETSVKIISQEITQKFKEYLKNNYDI